MAGNRKAAEAYLIQFIEQLCPGGENKAIYEQSFARMSDEEFEAMMDDFENERDVPPVYTPNFSETAKLDLERNLALGEAMGHNFFPKLEFHSDDPDTPTYQSPIPAMVVLLGCGRQAQLLEKKLSVPENNNNIDQLSGQPAGDSRSSKISYPELQIMRGMGLDKSIEELMKYRGGDIKGFNVMNQIIARDGVVHMSEVEPHASGVESTKTLNVWLIAMHLENTLLA